MKVLRRIKLEKEAENPFYLDNPKLFDIYKKCLPPKESYFYFPKHDEIITINPKNPIKSIRRIFYNTKYTDYENKMLNQLKQIINSHSEFKLPDYFLDYFVLMFVYARGGDLEASYTQMVEYINFCQKIFPFNITPKSKIVEILNKGFIYVYGRDNRFRPIIVCQSKIFQKYHKDYQFEELLQATSFMCQFVVNNMFLPGQFETWNMIVNLKGVSVISLPDSLKKLIPALSNYFLCRLNKNYIIGLNFFTRILYKIAVNFIDPITASKITVIESKKDPNLFKTIRKDNIEEQFGGEAPNMPIDSENGYFPPRMPSTHFIKDDERKENILISEENYIQKYKNGEIPIEVVSPYIYNKLKEKEKMDKIKVEEKNKNKKKENDNQKKIEQEIQRKLDKKRKIIDLKKIEIDKIKKFVNDYNWNYGDELTNINLNSKYDIKSNIINDINKFSRKKENYSKNILSLNN